MNILETTNIQTRKSSINAPVLILNQDYSPLGICLAKRAIVLIFSEKAETVINSDNSIKSISKAFLVPSVIKILKYIKRPYGKKISRFGILARDNFTCQYCKNTKKKLTIDHIIPKSRNGNHSWNNVATACTDCNHKKAGRTPEEAKMRLIKKPSIPNLNTHILKYSNNIQTSWSPFLFK